jgi:hypothetical protein
MEISIDVSALEKKITTMLAQIDHFKRVDIGAELSDWQTHDMHRHRPFTMRSRAKGKATTKIRPHSLFETKRSALARERILRRARASARRRKEFFAAPPRSIRRWSSRPILRQELEDVLDNRLRTAFREKLKWR